MNVKQLKYLLQDLPDDMPVGRIGHFGELHEMSPANFCVGTAYIPPADKSWRLTPDHIRNNPIPVLDVQAPDIGDQPD